MIELKASKNGGFFLCLKVKTKKLEHYSKNNVQVINKSTPKTHLHYKDNRKNNCFLVKYTICYKNYTNG